MQARAGRAADGATPVEQALIRRPAGALSAARRRSRTSAAWDKAYADAMRDGLQRRYRDDLEVAASSPRRS